MHEILQRLNLSEVNSGAGTGTDWFECGGAPLESVSPVDGGGLGRVMQASEADYDRVVNRALAAFKEWRQVPAPRRGEIVRRSCREEFSMPECM